MYFVLLFVIGALSKNPKNFKIFNSNDSTTRVENHLIPTLRSAIFTNSEKTTNLIIDNCGVREIEPGFLANASISPEKIEIRKNSIEVLFSETFKNLEVRQLFLDHNEICVLEDNTFCDLANLETLDLSHNALTVMSGSMVKNVPKLRVFNIEKNRIAILENYSFGFIETKARIFAGFNNLVDLKTWALSGTKGKILLLNLTHNYFDILPPFFFENITLERVDLSFNIHLDVFSLLQSCLTCKIAKLDIRPFGVSPELIEWAYGNDISLLFHATGAKFKPRPIFLLLLLIVRTVPLRLISPW
ncbi:hypothetical protein TcasGA2_TC006561 [Tribolium castaneum]|uniref:Uncharacterized protein n=1 Tax=Tribolium castaneum TaxID=7070 RepID=D6WXK7_TRICA|nr:hypothetical protein TcasGA2_TC006561 [Tribolium castaneum]